MSCDVFCSRGHHYDALKLGIVSCLMKDKNNNNTFIIDKISVKVLAEPFQKTTQLRDGLSFILVQVALGTGLLTRRKLVRKSHENNA